MTQVKPAQETACDTWREIFEAKAAMLYPASDPSHDVGHIRRVVKTAMEIAAAEGADPFIVLPAAYLHDFVNVPKDDPRRKQASRLSAAAAVAYLQDIGYPAQYLDAIAHAIAAHSFSANITPETIEAKVVQDADRLDALGAIGTARLFTVCGVMQRPYYHEEDPLAENRRPDDMQYAVDHFYVKLFNLPESFHTESARQRARARAAYMQEYLMQLKAEISGKA